MFQRYPWIFAIFFSKFLVIFLVFLWFYGFFHFFPHISWRSNPIDLDDKKEWQKWNSQIFNNKTEFAHILSGKSKIFPKKYSSGLCYLHLLLQTFLPHVIHRHYQSIMAKRSFFLLGQHRTVETRYLNYIPGSQEAQQHIYCESNETTMHGNETTMHGLVLYNNVPSNLHSLALSQ